MVLLPKRKWDLRNADWCKPISAAGLLCRIIMWQHLGKWVALKVLSIVSTKEQDLFGSINQQSLPEDDLLNISRNSCAKLVNCFLGNTLKKNGSRPTAMHRNPGLDQEL